MNWPKLLVFVRHGESEGNAAEDHAALGKSTRYFELTEKGVEQCVITKREYLDKKFPHGFDAYYTSYYERAKQSMRILYPDTQFYTDDRLAEMHEGIWETMVEKKIKQHYPGEIERKELDRRYHYRAPGGENGVDLGIRIRSFNNHLKKWWGNKKVFIVMHGRWMVRFQQEIHGWLPEETERRWNMNPFDNASITIYTRNKSELTLVEENVVLWKEIL
ncbi:histidine phosphatase family protein [Patescibacteria group bacterium AH-259-L05]|nr:histidine phosphatase family protein [Patescibacteria group bacterium AH-259-L05]